MKVDDRSRGGPDQPRMKVFADGTALAEALSDHVSVVLNDAVETRGQATLAVSGGSTPKLFFHALSRRSLPWDRISITLVDERFVPATDNRSNHRLVATHLLQNAASAARFLPLYSAGCEAPEAAALAAERLHAPLSHPLDVAVLGMGLDGHTASWFPDSPQLGACIDPEASAMVLSVEAPAAPEPRLTLTLPVIAAASLCVLHIEGDAKKRVYEEAVKHGSAMDRPVRALLNKSGTPPQVYWAP